VFRAPRGDFDRLYRRHVASVYRYAYAVLGNHADAEDVTQQTFLNAYRAIAAGTKPRKAENWLLTIAHNEVRRHFRRTHGKPLEVALDREVADVPIESADPSVADVVRALQHLPPLQRSALVMREFEGRSYAEIAEILGVTQPALETLLFRARRGLAEYLEEALTCAEAELALSRRLDGRLRRREARRLKEHLQECPLCARYAGAQQRQRSLLRGFSVMPIPASLFLFRGEHAAAAGFAGAAAAGGSTAVAGGGLSALGTAFAVKAAAVTATVGVAGGIGYTFAKPERTPKPEPRAAAAPAFAATQERSGRPIAASAAVVGRRRAFPVAPKGEPLARRTVPKSKATLRPNTQRQPVTVTPTVPPVAEPPLAAAPQPARSHPVPAKATNANAVRSKERPAAQPPAVGRREHVKPAKEVKPAKPEPPSEKIERRGPPEPPPVPAEPPEPGKKDERGR
jgi:RNA polymerase sigma factor (sigma-70 family)